MPEDFIQMCIIDCTVVQCSSFLPLIHLDWSTEVRPNVHLLEFQLGCSSTDVSIEPLLLLIDPSFVFKRGSN